MSSGKKASAVVQSPARDYDSDASSALDEDDRSDGESLDGDEVYQREVVARIYRPATLSDPSAYSVDIARQYSRPALNDKPVSKAVDFAAYTKAAAQAELLRATQKDAPPIKSHEFVSDDMKRMYADAFTRPSLAAKTPAIDFTNVKPTASDVMSTYDYSSWGGVASHHSARYSQARYDGPQMPPDLQVRADRADKSEAKRRATTQGLQSNAPEPVEEPAVDHKELARKAERARVEHEIVETNDVERKDFLRMLLSLQSDVDREQQEKRDQQQQAAVAPPTTEEKPVSVKPAHVDPVMAPVFDFAAASVLANRVNHDDEAEEIRNATRRFYTAVAIIEDLVTGDELTGLVRQLLERYRRQFQASKALRERGEYSHADHEAFRHFATIVEDYIFSRVAREVGPDFDVEEFFEKVFEEEDDAEERATVARSEDSARDRLTQRAASYPVLSSDAWELLLAIMSFESFTDLMDHFIFTYNKSAVSQHQRATSSSQQSFQPSLSSAAPDAPTRAKPAAVPTKTAPKPPAPARR